MEHILEMGFQEAEVRDALRITNNGSPFCVFSSGADCFPWNETDEVAAAQWLVGDREDGDGEDLDWKNEDENMESDPEGMLNFDYFASRILADLRSQRPSVSSLRLLQGMLSLF